MLVSLEGFAFASQHMDADRPGMAHQFMYDWHMYIAASGNVYDNTTGAKDTGLGGTRDTNDPTLNAGVEEAAAFTPPYQYTLDKAADVPAIVQKCAGPQ